MKNLRNGEFFGQTTETLRFGGLTITDTEYTHSFVDWHYHENPYFTFLLQGNMIEGNKKEVYDCAAGTLLYHHWQDSHYNKKPDVFTRGFHIEISEDWFDRNQLVKDKTEGSFNIKNPEVKLLMYRIFKETKSIDNCLEISADQILLNIFQQIASPKYNTEKNPLWVKHIDEILHETFMEKLNLSDLAKMVNIHPIHLSRDFPKYFHCTLGEYLRKLKVENSLKILNEFESLSEIALECGFSDQSHFIRCFKENIGVTPLQYKSILKK